VADELITGLSPHFTSSLSSIQKKNHVRRVRNPCSLSQEGINWRKILPKHQGDRERKCPDHGVLFEANRQTNEAQS